MTYRKRFKGMLRENIEPLLEKCIYEQSRIRKSKKTEFFFYFQRYEFSVFVKL